MRRLARMWVILGVAGVGGLAQVRTWDMDEPPRGHPERPGSVSPRSPALAPASPAPRAWSRRAACPVRRAMSTPRKTGVSATRRSPTTIVATGKAYQPRASPASRTGRLAWQARRPGGAAAPRAPRGFSAKTETSERSRFTRRTLPPERGWRRRRPPPSAAPISRGLTASSREARPGRPRSRRAPRRCPRPTTACGSRGCTSRSAAPSPYRRSESPSWPCRTASRPPT